MQATKHKWQKLLEEAQRAHQQEKDLNSTLQQQLDQVCAGCWTAGLQSIEVSVFSGLEAWWQI
jgi:hypothetical protein